MPHRHLRFLTIAAATALMAGSFAGVTQAADPIKRIPDASPTQMRDLNGTPSATTPSRPVAVPPGQEMKGVPTETRATPLIPPSEADRKRGAASRTSGKEGGSLVPIGTLNVVHGEQPRQYFSDSVAQRPPVDVDQGISRGR
jgi:hypothetical protein